MKKNDLALLIVTYARGYQVEILVRKAISAGIQTIFIWIDGAKTEEILGSQLKMLENIKKVNSQNKNVKVRVFRAKDNCGAAASVLAGASLMFKEVKNGVILEDDLQIDETFFADISKGMDLAELDSNIWMVAGTRLLPRNQSQYWELMNYPVGWGWGTTSEKWGQILKGLFQVTELKSIQNIKTRGYWKTGYRRASEGITDAWDTPLAAIMFAKKKTCLIPPVNLVTNIGNDEYATHTKNTKWPLGVSRKSLPRKNVIFEDKANLESNNRYYEVMIFGIGFRHTFAPLYDYLLRFLKIQKSKNLKPLSERMHKAIQDVMEITL